ncbi:putative dolichyl pyrophosphate Man9GlcNAc2 alpha-1,3-glucosyltransferase isoform X2 [Nicotiana tabacum]|uniref:Alpha-1,3-glucosyltransferase n=1 Tax=Nicotiana tabacum TaxID=4097 RepID=A0A1S4BQP2_TOBAC|nr:PREDICTED: probable dolichyl pyrophosphate Man9GlcNAc2 alpha-1,3-glucosyltransferase isoform X2 [Nicotiana tabacum]
MEKKKKAANPTSDDSESNLWSFLTPRGTTASFVCITLFAILVRVAVSIHPYSGAGTPPKYGDYEAQRHWMEITLNLPVKEWYRNSTVNDLKYWGLDYPPLTAYQSYIHGLFLRFFDPQSVALFTSRGYESYIGKLLMRWTVLLSDVLIFFPAVIYFVTVYYSGTHDGPKSGNMWHFAMILLNPCLILIDHGHFQYNCISLGFTVAAVSAILSDRDIFGSILFTLSLNHKQVLSRLAPFERGIYEDYVANFWCTTSVIVKWKRLFSTQALRILSLVSTVSTCLPSMMLLILAPSRKNFLFGLLSSALSFYFFSFQVHEKSILLPLLPASFLAIDEPLIFRWLTYFALLSLFPLLRRDELILPYIALYGLFVLLYNAPVQRKDIRETRSHFTTLKYFLITSSLLLHIVYLMVTPPRRYPYLFEAVMMLLCFSQFFFIFMYANMKQWEFLKLSSQIVREKKNL